MSQYKPTLFWSILGFTLAACGPDGASHVSVDAEIQTEHTNGDEFTGSLHAQIMWNGNETNLSGMLWSAQCKNGISANAWVPMLPVSTDLPKTDPDTPTYAADWFVVLPPGECSVTVVATTDDQNVSPDCAAVTLTVVVIAHVTTELVVDMPCVTHPTGGIDIVGVFNTPPVLLSAHMSPDVATPCSPAVITVVAEDPDNDPLSYMWVALQAEPPLTLTTTGASATVTTPGPGPVWLRLLVQDSNGGTAGVDIQVPVNGTTAAPCPE